MKIPIKTNYTKFFNPKASLNATNLILDEKNKK